MSVNLKSLLADLSANPEKIDESLKNLTTEQLDQVMKEIVPYDTVMSPNDNRILALAYTNLSEDYMLKNLTTALVAFMYRRSKEFCIMPHKDAETKENAVAREVITKFLNSLFEYDPDKHVQECAKVPKTEKDIKLARDAMAVGDAPANVNIEETLKNTTSNAVPNDTFAWFRMYHRDNFESLRWATMILYGVLPQVELMVQPCEVFDGKNPMEEYKVYESMHRDNLKHSLTATTFGSWNLLGSFQKNKDKVSFLNKNTEVLARILEQHKQDEAIGAELLKKRVTERKKENIRREGPDSDKFKDHLRDMPVEGMGQTRLLSEEDREKLNGAANTDDDSLAIKAAAVLGDVLAKDAPLNNPIHNVTRASDAEYLDDHNPPENALAVNVYTTDKKGLKKSHFFTEAVAPDKEAEEAEKRFKELKAAEDKEREVKREAEISVKSKAKKATNKGGSRK